MLKIDGWIEEFQFETQLRTAITTTAANLKRDPELVSVFNNAQYFTVGLGNLTGSDVLDPMCHLVNVDFKSHSCI